MQKRTKILAGIGILALGGLLVATQFTGNTEDFQGRFSVKQNTAGQQMTSNKNKKGINEAVTSNTLAGTTIKIPESAASKSVEEMLKEVPSIIKAADELLVNANNNSDSINNTLERVVTKLDAGDGSGAISLLDSAESELAEMKTNLGSLKHRETRLQDYNDVLEVYLEEDWPNLIELIENNVNQATSDLQKASRNAFITKAKISTATQELNTLYTEYGEIYLELNTAENHRESAIREKANFEDGIDIFQQYHADRVMTEIEMYGAIEDLITGAIPVLRMYHPNIKDDDNLYITNSSGREEVARVATNVIPNKYQDLINVSLPESITELSVLEAIKDQELTSKQNERNDLIEELEELEAEIESLTDALSADTNQGQTAANAMIDLVKNAMIDGMQLTLQLAKYFGDSNTAELNSYLNSYEAMIPTYLSLAEQLQALE